MSTNKISCDSRGAFQKSASTRHFTRMSVLGYCLKCKFNQCWSGTWIIAIYWNVYFRQSLTSIHHSQQQQSFWWWCQIDCRNFQSWPRHPCLPQRFQRPCAFHRATLKKDQWNDRGITSGNGADEKLGSVGVWTGIGHGKNSRDIVLEDKVFIGEFFSVNGFATGTILPGKVASLAHELGNNTVERAALEAKSLLSSAQGAEVLGTFWSDVSA